MSKVKDDNIVLEQGNEIKFPNPANRIYEDTTTGTLVISGTSGPSPTPTPALGELTDVTTTNAQNGDYIIYDSTSSTWINTGVRFGGDLGVFVGGNVSPRENTIDYVTISTTSNAVDFGDLTVARYNFSGLSNGNNDRGVFGGGNRSTSDNSTVIDYITISTPGNAIGFGDLATGVSQGGSTSNGTNERGVFAGGNSDGGRVNIISYITINTPGNTTDFGDLTRTVTGSPGTSNGTNERGVFGGGYVSAISNVIEYITINTTGNATDFGDLPGPRNSLSAASNGTNERGVFSGGGAPASVNIIEYITINSPSSAIDFGDLTAARYLLAALSNDTDETGVIAGGTTGTASNIIDYITINSISDASDFGDLTTARFGVAAASNGATFTTGDSLTSGTSGTSGTSAEGVGINALSDVDASSPSDGNILVYDATTALWISVAYDTEITDLNLVSLQVSDDLVIPTTEPAAPVDGNFWSKDGEVYYNDGTNTYVITKTLV